MPLFLCSMADMTSFFVFKCVSKESTKEEMKVAKILNLTGKREMIFKGDVVSYDGIMCLVGMDANNGFTVLIELQTGELIKRYDNVLDVDTDEKVMLICDRDKVTVTLEK